MQHERGAVFGPSTMDHRGVPQSRAERLIAVGRFVLAVASLGAIYLDPLEPARFPALAYGLLIAYSVYALLAVGWSFYAAGISRSAQIASHLVDLTFFGTINFMTAGPASPFFTYFVFGITCAMLRFGRRGTIYTAAAAAIVFFASGIGHGASPLFELNRFIIRSAYLLVVASLLIYLAGYQQRIQGDLARIARWPRSVAATRDELVTALLHQVMAIFDARRAFLAWEYLDERVAYLCPADGKAALCTPDERELADTLLDTGGAPFVSVRSIRAVTPGDAPLPDELAAKYGIDAAVSTPFKGDFVRGRLVLLDGRAALLEDVNLARIAGGVIAGRLDHYHAAEHLRRGAVAEERVRVARDLHDSVLQSLTGVALQLRTLPRLMARNPEEAQQRLDEIEAIIATGQKELRWFIGQLNPERERNEHGIELAERLSSMSERFRQQWGLEVENDIAPVVHILPSPMRYEIYTIVSEAVANAARHAEARRITVSVDVDARDVCLDIADDGRGFPFHGRYDLEEMTTLKRGPVTLKERVSSLGGQMIIESSENGARLQIRVPLRGAQA